MWLCIASLLYVPLCAFAGTSPASGRAVADAYATALLFLGAATHGPRVPPATAARNLAFLKRYAGIEMPRRTAAAAAAAAAAIDEGRIQSGDMLGIVRLDGLDPLIMWGTGAHQRLARHTRMLTGSLTQGRTWGTRRWRCVWMGSSTSASRRPVVSCPRS